MYIVKYRKFFLGLSLLFVVLSFGAIAKFGLKLGIDFTGGSVLQVAYDQVRPDIETVKKSVEALNLGAATVQEAGDKDVIVRTRSLAEPERQSLIKALSDNGTIQMTEKKFDSIGPTIGAELRTKSLWSVLLVILLIVLYITFAFRKVSYPVSSWKYGLAAVVALLHDVIVPTGFFVVFNHYVSGEIDVLYVTAILTIVGFSVHDTIVVFDRIRENLRTGSPKTEFTETVGKSLNQTFGRSINTSLSVILVLLVLLFAGGESTKNFALLLTVGIFFGTYSSIFLASPLLILIKEMQDKKLAKGKK
ncbi:MAG: protein translocase subunit SecF [Candidatus Paceibacterota bacterium]|jgi:preprotein translocase subunit SecF